MREHEPAGQFLEIEAGLSKSFGQAFEEFGVRRRVVLAEVVDGLGKTMAEKVTPRPVHDCLRKGGARLDQCRQLLAAVDTVRRAVVHHGRQVATLGDFGAVDEHGVGHFHEAVPELVIQLRLLRIAPFAGEILVDELDPLHVVGPATLPQGSCLPEERVEFPELVLLALVERMVVALRALHLKPEKNLCGLGGRLHTVLDAHLLHLATQEVGRPVEPVELSAVCVHTGRRNQFLHEAVVGHVFGEGPAEVLPHASPIHPIVGHVAANQHRGPDVGPVPRVLIDVIVAQQPRDEFRLLGRRGVGEKRPQFIDAGNAADEVKVHSAAPLPIGRGRRRQEARLIPALGHLLVDVLDLGDAVVLGRIVSDGTARGHGHANHANHANHDAQHASEADHPHAIPHGTLQNHRPTAWQSSCDSIRHRTRNLVSVGLGLRHPAGHRRQEATGLTPSTRGFCDLSAPAS